MQAIVRLRLEAASDTAQVVEVGFRVGISTMRHNQCSMEEGPERMVLITLNGLSDQLCALKYFLKQMKVLKYYVSYRRIHFIRSAQPLKNYSCLSCLKMLFNYSYV